MTGVARSTAEAGGGPRRVVAGVVCGLVLAAGGVDTARTDDEVDTRLPEFRHGLENTRFAGEWTYEWDAEPVEGLLIFRDGRFVSRGCLEWGYEPAPYYVRGDNEGVHFQARLPNPEHGTMWFRGVFDGERLRVDVHWRKERWYWTLEQRYRFTGTPVAAGTPVPAVNGDVE